MGHIYNQALTHTYTQRTQHQHVDENEILVLTYLHFAMLVNMLARSTFYPQFYSGKIEENKENIKTHALFMKTATNFSFGNSWKNAHCCVILNPCMLTIEKTFIGCFGFSTYSQRIQNSVQWNKSQRIQFSLNMKRERNDFPHTIFFIIVNDTLAKG